MSLNAPLGRKLRMGLVGGGQGSFIGRVHSIAGVLDHRAALVAGALSADPAKSKASAQDYGIAPERAYGSYQEMVQGEKKLPEGDRIDFAAIATPNHTHFEIAKAFAEAGFNVICDKPLTFDLPQAEELATIVDRTGVVFGVTHNYTGYPMVRQARAMVRAGEIGDINALRAFYIQGWLRTRQERGGMLEKQAAWRTDPKKSGIAGCFGDIGTHAYNLGRYITGALPEQVSCLLKDICSGPRSGRLRHRRDSLSKRRPGNGDRFPNLSWPGKRFVDRNRRHQGLPRMAPGKPESTLSPRQWPTAPHVYARSECTMDGRLRTLFVSASQWPPGSVF